MTKPIGYYYRYRSRIDGAPCVAILTMRSKNGKTGAMRQLWFLSETIDPLAARQCERERTTCGTCPLKHGNGCYVRVEQAPLAVWRAYHTGAYAPWDTVPQGLTVRIGAYGDPGSMRAADFRRMIGALRPARWTGYTHAWRAAPWLREWCMASTTLKDNCEAVRANWSTFCVLPPDRAPLKYCVQCASEKKGKHCVDCLLCRGIVKIPITVTINAHGGNAGKVYS